MTRLPGSIVHSIFIAFVLLLSGLQLSNAQVDTGTLWRDAVVTELDVDFGDTGFHARWQYHRCDCGDLHIQVEQIAPDGTLVGELLLVDGQALLSNGFEGQGEDIEPLIQAPSLMLQLAFALLSASQPEGPSVINKNQALNRTEEKKEFSLNTGLASGTFAAPWSIEGAAWKAESGHRRFELHFRFNVSAPGQSVSTEAITFSGDLDYEKQEFPYPESTDLKGWRVQWLSHNEQESKPIAEGYTLKMLRDET